MPNGEGLSVTGERKKSWTEDGLLLLGLGRKEGWTETVNVEV